MVDKKRLKIFLKLKLNEIWKLIKLSIKFILAILIAIGIAYGLFYLLMCGLLYFEKTYPIITEILAIGLIVGIVVLFFVGIAFAFIEWIKKNWEKAGKLAKRNRK